MSALAEFLATALAGLAGSRRAPPGPVVARLATDGHCPSIDVIVPVHNEAPWIAEKIRDCAALDYPAGRLRVWIVDGASTDGTLERARLEIGTDTRFRVLLVGVAHKTAQLNAALRHATAAWVAVTDADARLPPETLRTLAAAASADPGLGAVGTLVRPGEAHPLEHLHWRLSNLVRRAEAALGCASLVVAPCYVFRRAVLPSFPSDVVADDVHVSLAAAAAGLRVGLALVTASELRSPVDPVELFAHKRRKVEAYLRELLRFLPLSARMGALPRWLYACRLACFTAVPVLGVLALASITLRGGASAAVAVAACALAVAGLSPSAARHVPGVLLLPALLLLLAAASLVVLCNSVVRWRRGAVDPTRPSPIRIRGSS